MLHTEAIHDKCLAIARGCRAGSGSVCQVNLLQDDIKFIVVAIISSAVSWTMVNRNNIMMNKSELLAII